MNAPVSPAAAIGTDSPVVARQDVDSIALLTLNRPESRNALSEGMIEALAQAFATIEADRAVRAVVLAAEGPAFSAGHDLKEITAHRRDPDGGLDYVRRLMLSCSELMLSIMRLPQPVIAAVGTTATAAGCQLVATCDLAVASQDARFATPGVHIGLFCSTPMVALTRNVAAKHAMEMLLTGETVSAEDAWRMGLVNRVVPAGRERDEALALARKIAAKSALTVRLGKQAFYRQRELGVAEAYRYASEVMVENMMARDAAEGIGAFVEKRNPSWEDR
jgi:enoyl-CoA hydratase/carnithine racemase